MHHTSLSTRPPGFNAAVAARLREAADLLRLQGANEFRIAAYRRAAETVSALDEDLMTLTRRDGMNGLIRLPGIGQGIASAIVEMGETGQWDRLNRMRGDLDPVRRLQAVPGIGHKLAARLHDVLHVDTLEGLEAAIHDGRAAALPGLGPRRLAALASSLDTMLGRVRSSRPRSRKKPEVKILLDVDTEYRKRAATGDLRTIAPKRFNPRHESWLPILHTQRGDWHFTALFSNTRRAHELNRTNDWVVIYSYDGDDQESQFTVVTESRGPLRGRRTIRGREEECRIHYEKAGTVCCAPS
jgi:putative hydrolase